jgi:hypothetical protein
VAGAAVRGAKLLKVQRKFSNYVVRICLHQKLAYAKGGSREAGAWTDFGDQCMLTTSTEARPRKLGSMGAFLMVRRSGPQSKRKYRARKVSSCQTSSSDVHCVFKAWTTLTQYPSASGGARNKSDCLADQKSSCILHLSSM